MNSNSRRREFLLNGLKLTGLVTLAHTLNNGLFGSQSEAADKKAPATKKPTEATKTTGSTSLPMIDPKDPIATNLKYTETASSAPESKGNKCSTCNFYAKKETIKGKEAGTCMIFAGKMVAAEGWCVSWNKKP